MILHVDMDAFYASVEEREQPALRGKPVVVGGTPEGRGVVAAASYAAREFGVRSAMPAAQAKRLCPHAIFLPSRMSLYADESARIREIFHRYTPLVEPLSLDEAFLDVRASERLFGEAPRIAAQIKADIRAERQLIASVGVAPTKFVAKIASDFEKPDGLVVVKPPEVQGFLDALPISALWGVGRATGARFAQLGVRTIAELRALPEELVTELFGRQGDHLWQLAHGIDHRKVVPQRKAKSISHETTFSEDVVSLKALRTHLVALVEQVAARVRRPGLRARKVQIKVRFEDFRTITRVTTLAGPTDSTRVIREAASELLSQNVRCDSGAPDRMIRPVRLIGIGVSALINAEGGAVLLEETASPQAGVDAKAAAVPLASTATATDRPNARLASAAQTDRVQQGDLFGDLGSDRPSDLPGDPPGDLSGDLSGGSRGDPNGDPNRDPSWEKAPVEPGLARNVSQKASSDETAGHRAAAGAGGNDGRDEAVDGLVDKIRERYGNAAVQRGHRPIGPKRGAP